jgi:hypothetical protein
MASVASNDVERRAPLASTSRRLVSVSMRTESVVVICGVLCCGQRASRILASPTRRRVIAQLRFSRSLAASRQLKATALTHQVDDLSGGGIWKARRRLRPPCDRSRTPPASSIPTAGQRPRPTVAANAVPLRRIYRRGLNLNCHPHALAMRSSGTRACLRPYSTTSR